MTGLIQIETSNYIRRINFNRPDKKNAITGAMYQAAADAINSAESDPEVRVIMFTASGEDFCAGNDLQDFLDLPPESEDSPTMQFILALANTNLPIIAAVNGQAVGIGATLLLNCDFVYATSSARFLFPFVNLGIVPEACSTMLLPQLVGQQKAAELLLLGEPFDAETALSIGLINRICVPDELAAVAEATASKLITKAPAALRETKALLKLPPESRTDRCMREGVAFMARLKTQTCREMLSAFLEKRSPDPAKLVD